MLCRIVSIVFLALIFPQAAHAYGAQAVGLASNGIEGGFMSWNAPSQQFADQNALDGCRQQGLNGCTVIQRFSNACLGNHQNRNTGRIFAAIGSSEWEAMNRAADLCRSQYRDAYNHCFPTAKACDTGTVADPRQPQGTAPPARTQAPAPSPSAPQPTRQQAQPEGLGLLIFFLAIGCAFVLAWWFLSGRSSFPEEKLPPPRDPNQPASPEETKKAINHMRVAQAYFEDAFAKAKDANEQEAMFRAATRSLVFARSLDPKVTIEVKDKEGNHTTAIDQLSGKILFYESTSNYDHGQKMNDAYTKWIGTPEWAGDNATGRHMDKRRKANIKEAYKKAILPAEKSVTYAPSNLTYLCNLVRVYRVNGMEQKAKEALQRAEQMAPDDIEVLKLAEY